MLRLIASNVRFHLLLWERLLDCISGKGRQGSSSPRCPDYGRRGAGTTRVLLHCYRRYRVFHGTPGSSSKEHVGDESAHGLVYVSQISLSNNGMRGTYSHGKLSLTPSAISLSAMGG